jgi:hypothetical protein
MGKVESEALGRDIGSRLVDMCPKYLTESLEHEMTRRVESCRLSSIISQSSFELPCRSRTRELLMLLECSIESFDIHCETMLFRELDRHLEWESIGIKKGKCLSS